MSRHLRRPPAISRLVTELRSPFISRGVGATATQTLVQRLADRQPRAPGGKPSHGRARNPARDRAAGAARCRHRLYEFAARRGDPRAQPPQRRSPHRAAQADARPLQRRRGDAHRRGAGGIAARRRPFRAARRAVELRHLAGQLSPRDRRRAGPAARRHAGRPAFASDARRAIAQGEQQSPSVLAAMYGVDIAELAVKINEGSLYPNLGADARAHRRTIIPSLQRRQAVPGVGASAN